MNTKDKLMRRFVSQADEFDKMAKPYHLLGNEEQAEVCKQLSNVCMNLAEVVDGMEFKGRGRPPKKKLSGATTSFSAEKVGGKK